MIHRRKFAKNIEQGPLIPGDSVSRIFTVEKPINTGALYLDEKAKSRLLTSSRAFSNKPNSK